MRIALGQMEVAPGRPDINSQAMLKMINEAKQSKADMIIFPEMAVPGYLLGDTWEQTAFLRDCEAWGREIIQASHDMAVLFGNVAVDWNKRGDDGRVRKYNAFFTAYQGKLWGEDNFPYPYRIKTLLPNYREFDDTRHFYGAGKLAAELGVPVTELLQPVQLNLAGQSLSLGCILCEDGWCDDYAVKPAAALAQQHTLDLLINISSSPFTLGKNNKRHRLFSSQAKRLSLPLIYVNNVGLQNNGKTVYTFDGCSTVYNGKGEIAAHCPPFAACLTTIDYECLKKNNVSPVAAPDDTTVSAICQALQYGTKKFLQAAGIEKVVIGLSGGIDSAVNAALHATVLPPENLLLVNMPSVYNSATTKSLAEKLAKQLGCWYGIVPIQESVNHTVSQINETRICNAGGCGFTLSLTPFMLENIQARDRSARVLAGMAAAFGGGFTCNANKSELTAGYATLYGDQAGFLAALADLWKHQVYDLGRYLNESVYQSEIIPEGIFSIVPSAELSHNQAVDEGKGDPLTYPYHDYLFRAFIERWERATPEDILHWYIDGVLEEKIGCQAGIVSALFAGPQDFITDLERWWRLYTGLAVAKRIQAPPVLAVSRRAYGFDHREAQNTPYFTAAYLRLKQQLLKTN